MTTTVRLRSNRKIDVHVGMTIGEWNQLLRNARNGERPTIEQMMVLHIALNVIADLSAGRTK